MLFLVYEEAAMKHVFISLLPEIRQVMFCVILTRLYSGTKTVQKLLATYIVLFYTPF